MTEKRNKREKVESGRGSEKSVKVKSSSEERKLQRTLQRAQEQLETY